MSYAIRNDLLGWRAVDGPDDCGPDEHYSEAQPASVKPDPRDEWKVRRAEVVSAIKVTTLAGHTFDGDEVSQGRMARAILGLQTMPGSTVTWVLADNSVIQATTAELSEALALAGAAQAAIWVAE